MFYIFSGINDKYMSDRWNEPKKKREKIASMMIDGDFISSRPLSTLTLMH